MRGMAKRLLAVVGAALLLAAFAGGALPSALAQPGEAGAASEYISENVYHLAEGCTRDGFETWLTVANIGDGQLMPGETRPQPPNPWWKLEVSYVTNEGVVAEKTYDLPMQSRTTIDVNAEIGPGYDVSFVCRVTSNLYASDVIIERPMYFSYVGRGGHVPWQGGHVGRAVWGIDPSLFDPDNPCHKGAHNTWYFAEGTTRQDSERHFDEWICVLNPTDQPTALTFNYMIEGEGLVVKKGTLPARHRGTWYVPDHVGLNKDVSLELVAEVPIYPERAMYFQYRSVNPQRPGRAWYGGHIFPGSSREKLDSVMYRDYDKAFAFAPVSYVPGMGWADTWVCFQNPNTEKVPIKLTFSTPGGLMAFIKWLPPQQRSTFYYPELLAEYGISSSRDPGAFKVDWVDGYPYNILVERPLYMEFDRPAATGQTPSGGTVIGGFSSSSAVYAEGYTGPGFDTWMALNYFDDSGQWQKWWEESVAEGTTGNWHGAHVYFPGGGEPVWRSATTKELQAAGFQGCWYTYMWHVNKDFPNAELSLEAYSSGVERIMIFNYKGKWCGMHSSGDYTYK
ncbi:MAG: hypothetical protein HPY75_03280 [Actinobacteria bacterium]|nr:hypothetical protein [Actinomycetota bacterium]